MLFRRYRNIHIHPVTIANGQNFSNLNGNVFVDLLDEYAMQNRAKCLFSACVDVERKFRNIDVLLLTKEHVYARKILSNYHKGLNLTRRLKNVELDH